MVTRTPLNVTCVHYLLLLCNNVQTDKDTGEQNNGKWGKYEEKAKEWLSRTDKCVQM